MLEQAERAQECRAQRRGLGQTPEGRGKTWYKWTWGSGWPVWPGPEEQSTWGWGHGQDQVRKAPQGVTKRRGGKSESGGVEQEMGTLQRELATRRGAKCCQWGAVGGRSN